MKTRLLAVLAAVIPLVASASEEPPWEYLPEGYFDGSYVLLGQDDGSSSAFHDRLNIAESGGGLRLGLDLETCARGTGHLDWAEGPERIRFFRGVLGGQGISCQVFTGMGNYPYFVCKRADGGYLAAFPDPDAASECLP